MSCIRILGVVLVWTGVFSSALAEKYYETDTSGNDQGTWNVVWYDTTGGTSTTVQADGEYYIGGGTSATQQGLIRANSNFTGKTLYVGVRRDGTLMELGKFNAANSTLQVNGTSIQVADLQLGNGAISLYGNNGNTLKGEITVLPNADKAVLRAWSSGSSRTFNVNSTITGGVGSTLNVYSYNPDPATSYVCTVNIGSTNNTFAGTWNLTEKSQLSLTAANGLGTASRVTTSEDSKLILKASQEFAGLTLANNATLQLNSATAEIADFQLGNGNIELGTGSGTATINGTITVAENAQATFTVKPKDAASVKGQYLYVGTINGGEGATLTVETQKNSVDITNNSTRLVVLGTNSTFTGTWDVTADSFLYLGTSGSSLYNDGLGKGANVTMAADSKIVLFDNQELKDLTITGSGTTMTPGNGKTLRVTGTFRTDGTLINASTGVGLNVLSGSVDDSNKTAYIRSIQKYTVDGEDNFYLGYNVGTGRSGNLYVNTIGSSETGMDMNLVHYIGDLGAYSPTGNQGIEIFGNYSHSTGTSANSSLSLDVAGGQSLDVAGTIAITSGMTLKSTTSTALNSRKPYKVVSSAGTATGLDKIKLGTNLDTYEKEVVGNALYVGTYDSLHTYYTTDTSTSVDFATLNWNRYGIEGATSAGITDNTGLYYITYTDPTKTAKNAYVEMSQGTFAGKTLYVGYALDGTLLDFQSLSGNYSTLRFMGNGTYTVNDLRLGNGGLLAGGSGVTTLEGNVIVDDGANAVLRINNSSTSIQRGLKLSAALSGKGVLNVAGRTASTYVTTGYVDVDRANNAFAGTWKVSNDTTLISRQVGALGTADTKLELNSAVIDGKTYGESKVYILADQSLAKVTVNAKDAVLFVGSAAEGNSVTLSTPELSLAENLTLDNQSLTLGGVATQYYAGVLKAEEITSTADVTLNLANGTLKTNVIGTDTNNVDLVQTSGTLAGFDTDTTGISLFGDYTQTGGTLALALGRESLLVDGNLSLTSLSLFADPEFTPETGQTYDLLNWSDGHTVDLTGLVLSLDETLQNYGFNLSVQGNGFVATVTSLGSVPEPATWLLLLLGFLGLKACKRRDTL